MPRPTTAPHSADEATFYLDELDLDSWQGGLTRWKNPYAQCFAFVAFGSLAVTGSTVALVYGTRSPFLWFGLALGVSLLGQALFLWNRRPFLHLDDEGLTFRLRRLGAEQSVRWDELASLTLKPTTVVLHRHDEPPLPLRFDTVSYTRLRQLKGHLADTAHEHGVSVSQP